MLAETGTSSSKMWSVNTDDQWHLEYLNEKEVWDKIDNSCIKPQTVNVWIPTMWWIDIAHIDLSKNIKTYIDNTSPRLDYGTHISWIVWAVTNNNKWIRSMAHDKVKIIWMWDSHRYDNGDFSAALEKLANAWAKIIYINRATNAFDQNIVNTIKKLSNKWVIFIASGPMKSRFNLPYPISHEPIIQVWALAQNWNIASYNDLSSKISVDIYMPGSNILSTVRNNKYSKASWTGPASAVMTSVTAMFLALDPTLDTDTIVTYAKDIPGSVDKIIKDKCGSTPVCWNNIREGNEQCDGNTKILDGYICTSQCRLEKNPERVICGNGRIEAGEQCDDGNTRSGDGCSSRCTKEATSWGWSWWGRGGRWSRRR